MADTSCTPYTKQGFTAQVTPDTGSGGIGLAPWTRTFKMLIFSALLLPLTVCSGQIAEGSVLEKHRLPLREARISDTLPPPARTVRVWLPPGYPDAAPYPVLVLLDGQNLFDALTAYAGEWGVDEALSARQALGAAVPVVIGVDNGGADRIAEYSPFVHTEYPSGRGAEHLDFIVQRVLPWAQDRFALSRERAKTGFGGSSLGGLMAVWAGLQENQPFGFLLAFSPSLWFNPEVLDAPFQNMPDSRWYLAMGSRESSSDSLQVLQFDRNVLDPNAGNVLELGNRLRRAGYGPARLRVTVDPEGQHNESTWRRWMPQAITWWLDAPPAASQTDP